MPDQKPRNLTIIGALIIGALGAIAVVMILSRINSQRSRSGEGPGSLDAQIAALPTLVLRTIHLFNGQSEINAGEYIYVNFQVTPDMIHPSVVGKFTAFGGAENDIEAYLVDSMSFVNWVNGHSIRAYYSTDGHETTGEVNVHNLPTGSYTFIFSNRFSAISRKQVTAGINFIYDVRQ